MVKGMCMCVCGLKVESQLDQFQSHFINAAFKKGPRYLSFFCYCTSFHCKLKNKWWNEAWLAVCVLSNW